MNAAEAIREARNVIMERGWAQGSYKNSGGEVCAVGALLFVTRGRLNKQLHNDAYTALQKAIDLPHSDCISVWNDADSRTIHEVLDAFDRAEKIAESECLDQRIPSHSIIEEETQTQEISK
jgi:hypothetical protein